MSSTSGTASRDGHDAGRRAREVYRYFRPERLSAIKENTAPDSIEFLDEPLFQFPAESNSRGRSPCGFSQRLSASDFSSQQPAADMSPMPESMVLGDSNSTLSSFAQLAALRLNMGRVFISVSDRDSQFIIAQAGQTSASPDNHDLLSQGLYTGCSTIDVSTWSMCQDTMALPGANRATGDYNFHISNDMTQDERYQHLALVKEDPKFRFYAGTPLTTDSNINVGCFFVLDTKPHPEFSRIHRESMGHIGKLIMDFLKVSRQASEGRRAARLSKGISHFVEGRSSFQTSRESGGSLSRQTSNASQNSGKFPHRKVRSASSRRSRSSSPGNSAMSNSNQFDPSNPPSYDAASSETRPRSNNDEVDVNLGNSMTFRRAANLIRESLELGEDSGVVFFEAGNGYMADPHGDSDISSSTEPGKPASILAVSTAEETFGPNEASPVPYPAANMDEEFLHRLLNRYEMGKIWSLHRDGQLSSSDSEDAGSKDRATSRRSPIRSTGSGKWKSKENKMLNVCFPGAAQVMFVPLWSASNSQWFGGCFCWNNIESTVFDTSVELGALLSFGSSVMVECSRIESLISDRQKADFLGSISHELRSPLHGILAAAEILQTTELDPYQGSLMDTVNACGRTLLDTMNQVLDYSKILSLEKRSRHLSRRRSSTLKVKNLHRSAAHLDVYSATDLSTLAEEVVDGVCLGHYHNQNFSSSSDLLTSLEAKHGATTRSTSSDPKVGVTIDIPPNNWIYHVPPGALRRIIMNVFSNAMKYTEAGQVKLRLEVEDSRHTTQEDHVTLTVSDTGKGISEEFQRSRLFTPFVQEDSLAIGSGLGLSIVQSLVKSLGGTINIQSQLGKGTTVKVTLPLNRPEQETTAYLDTLPSTSSEIRVRNAALNDAKLLRESHSGKTVSIINANAEDVSSLPSWSTVSHYLTDWFGLKLIPFPSSTPVDLLLFDGEPSGSDIQNRLSEKTTGLIFSNQYVGTNSARDAFSLTFCDVPVINRPLGPHKLARFIRKSFDKGNNLNLHPQQATLPNHPIEVTDSETKHLKPAKEIIRTENEPTEENPEPKDSSKSPSKGDTTRILVVEDNKINLNLMLAFLKKSKSVSVDSAENGRAALDAVKGDQEGYDIIFMDISMPVMNGFEATRAIRAFEKGRDSDSKPSTIVALTGLSSSVDEAEAIESGMDLFLTKPVAFQEVKKILDRWNEEKTREGAT